MTTQGIAQNALAPEVAVNTSAVLPVWRRWLIVAGAGLGLLSGFAGLYYSSLSFFLLPISSEFGWSRADISAASVLSMLGAAIAAPLTGKLFERFGAEKIILVSVLLFALGMLALSHLTASVLVLGGLSFILGLCGSATTIVGYLSILPRWFDGRLGLALGLAGLGLGLGVGLSPTIATHLIGAFGWRGAYQWMALFAFGTGLIAWLLIAPRGYGSTKETRARATASAAIALDQGDSLREAVASWRFWLLLTVIFATTFGILGAAIHGATLFSDRGLTPQQAAIGAGLAGVGAMSARLLAGILLDRFFAPIIGTVVFVIAATGLFLNSEGSSFPLLVLGTFMGGVAIGAEGDLLPFLVRRYFGMRSFSVIFGCLFIAYAMGGMIGPIVFGYMFDQSGSYGLIMRIAAGVCLLSALAMLLLGPYRFRALEALRKPALPVAR